MVNRELLHELDAASSWFTMAMIVAVFVAIVFLIVVAYLGEEE